MALTQFKVINLTNGRLELKPYNIVLGVHEWTALAAPLADEINWLMGRRFVKIEPMTKTKVQPFTLSEPARLPMTDVKRGGRQGRDRDQP